MTTRRLAYVGDANAAAANVAAATPATCLYVLFMPHEMAVPRSIMAPSSSRFTTTGE